MRSVVLFVLLVVFTLSVPVAQADNGNAVSEIGSNIMVIFHDSKGRHWFGSWQTGLYLYDGARIIHYTTTHGLPSNRIEEIAEDGAGNVLVNTSAGLCTYKGGTFSRVHESSLGVAVWALAAGDLWFKSQKPKHVCRYANGAMYVLELPDCSVGELYRKNRPSILDPYAVYRIYKDSKGAVWFGTAVFGALRYNGQSFDWISEPDVAEMHDGPSNGVRSIVEDKEGYFWFNAEYRYRMLSHRQQPKGSIYERVKSIGSLDGVKDGPLNEYISVAKDKAQNLWFATFRNEVWMYNGTSVKHYPVRENGKKVELYYIYNDNNGVLWLGSQNNGVWKFDGNRFLRFRPRA